MSFLAAQTSILPPQTPTLKNRTWDIISFEIVLGIDVVFLSMLVWIKSIGQACNFLSAKANSVWYSSRTSTCVTLTFEMILVGLEKFLTVLLFSPVLILTSLMNTPRSVP
ncbi:hypothetical protein WICPIJ_003250 [Wickerhamomyces pijperi]|uniref:Uncharacterized protein n=1 Tax=Wickerhamomyces pijperi TaxID=599730 RepID=A0A9P8Q7G4_WICPI|nr:hypothetical protein WICPIJ_003250 [Wickerhamomyces pijperi]